MYIENIKVLPILQISTGYPKKQNPTSQSEKWGFENQTIETSVVRGYRFHQIFNKTVYIIFLQLKKSRTKLSLDIKYCIYYFNLKYSKGGIQKWRF